MCVDGIKLFNVKFFIRISVFLGQVCVSLFAASVSSNHFLLRTLMLVSIGRA